MSTAFFPTNMRKQSSGGYNNKSTLENIKYVSWKGEGIFSNPIGITSANIRPLTNKDPANNFPTGFGLPRPLKLYRKGKLTTEPNRIVKSSVGSISHLIDKPGAYIVKDNSYENPCNNCDGVSMVSNWMPINNLTENPQPSVTNNVLCCNQQKKARLRVLPTNTNINKNYYQTTKMYLHNRCQTFKQRQFNFVTDETNLKLLLQNYPHITSKILKYTKPGDALSIFNYYVAQCNPTTNVNETAFIIALSKILLENGYISDNNYNIYIQETSIETYLISLKNTLTEQQFNIVVSYIANNTIEKKECAQVFYKPNNHQYAKQGAVSSSTRILKLNVDTINTNAYKNRKNPSLVATSIQRGVNPNIPFIYGDKYVNC